VIGDSHARGCATEIKSHLDENFDVQGFVNPGAGLSTIISSAKRDIQQLSKQDVVVVWWGAKDMGKNETKQGINWINNFEVNHHTNIILEAPHRQDLIQHSCVNKEVEKLNSKIKKHMKAHVNVEIVKANLNRGAFTKHGQHMNAMGKGLMAKRIIEVIKQKLKMDKKTPIIMKWREDTNGDKQDPREDTARIRKERDSMENQKDSAQTELNNNNQQEVETVGIVTRRN